MMNNLPFLDPQETIAPDYSDFLAALKSTAFSGDIKMSYGSRLAVATDNSIYQQLPQAVILPKSIDDLALIGQTAAQFPSVRFSARGGGTGTNGQSLTPGLIVDLSRYMNKVLEVNADEQWVRVQAGVVKDQLNDVLRPLGYFFAPDLSTSNRATIGGMVNTDASGQGSLVYGKTSDHVLGLTSVLVDGTVLRSQPMSMDEAQTLAQEPTVVGNIVKQLIETCVGKREQILAKFPRMNRFLTGYDLEHALNDELSQLDISRVITGSEGSLAFVAEAKLNITPIAKHKALVNIKYDSFESALRHAPSMVAAQATSVETVDSNVLNLAKQDIIWHSVKDLITDVPNKVVLGLNMVEYNSNDQAGIELKIAELRARLDKDIELNRCGVIGYQLTYDTAEINKIYGMRKKSVGLLGKTKGEKKPLAFVEDTGVPPENLADFIMEFRALLDARGLHYGMFGHVDAGVLHVRPALDMCDPAQEAMIPEISDAVAALVAKYGGLIWGEHGKGYRSEYSPTFFGEELYAELRKIKTAFDPLNKMNPGKICTPFESSDALVKVSDQKRGGFDRQIPVDVRASFEPAMSCNGNGLCFNYDTTSPMCPSFKITGDRRHSPKGRAGIIREWLRLLSKQNIDVANLEKSGKSEAWYTKLSNSLSKQHEADFSHEVLEVMDGCLACKACSSQCPVSVDVPGFRARFLNIYYRRYSRPLKDYLVGNIENMAPLMAKMPSMVNFFLRQDWFNNSIRKTVGYVDTPHLSVPTLEQRLDSDIQHFDLAQLKGLSETQKAKKVCIVQDPFTSYYEAGVVDALAQLITKLGYEPVLLPFMPNGKPQHVKGFLDKFAKTAQNAAGLLNELQQLAIPLVGIDPSMVLCYRDEYTKVLGDQRGSFQVQLVHEWLLTIDLPAKSVPSEPARYALFGHCSEKTALPASEAQWQTVFSKFGLALQPIAVGCCGMAGTFGHEQSHVSQSKGLYELSWQEQIAQFLPEQIVATGYSCRSQVARMAEFKPKHPLEVLLESLH
ncbi:MAG: FAD-binding oxidoreductase [Paraglaciecola sp.]|uniref:D-2-hydroxyglutarate dehydrogenase YdiJ n=1 Tax=Paraglaciecola sp. TaxID=1920173 RepID=UPI00273E95FD|nr:FAD-binding and (Fe-S)-binding domain-containing protein [Paraglaciecola sp.]MDP5031747.1 FAD-binding oxidoreductase [Paraglaciecola sp.]MDP5132880.1 FAD-binding oxidoreductase [Paraglaciecola sp.]